jgi:ketosteroid isomerase-like protein
MKSWLLIGVLSLAIAVAAAWGTGLHATEDNESEIRSMEEASAAALSARDTQKLMSLWVNDNNVVLFDVTPPLQYRGFDTIRKDNDQFFAEFDGALKVENREMVIVASGDVGFVHYIQHLSGTMKNGKKIDLTGRFTDGVVKRNGKWLIEHEHISVPADLATGMAHLSEH